MKRTTLLTILFFAAYVGLQAQSSTWNTLGNSFPFFNQNTYFLGTTTEYPLLFRTNNEDRMYISTTGNVGICSASLPHKKWKNRVMWTSAR